MPETVEFLETIARGSDYSQVTSGESLAQSIYHIKLSLGLFSEPLAPSAPEGYSLFFDEVIRVYRTYNWFLLFIIKASNSIELKKLLQLLSRQHAGKWFKETVPALASMLLMLPSLLETHWQRSDSFLDVRGGRVKIGLRLVDQQEAGIVVLSQVTGVYAPCLCYVPSMNLRHISNGDYL